LFDRCTSNFGGEHMTVARFTSDLHFNHQKCAEIRAAALGIDSFTRATVIDQHDEEIIRRFNSVVAEDDVTWILGDVGMANETSILEKVDRLNGSKRLIYGNHDKVWPGHRNAHKHFAQWLEVFDYMAAFAKISLNGRSAFLSHFPYIGDHTDEERYTEYRLKDTGLWLIHGHVHDEWLRNDNQINVGVDKWDFKPVTIGDLESIIRDTEKHWQFLGRIIDKYGSLEAYHESQGMDF
jgi:calcineurin-like phosphoesterase family protein